MRDPGMIWAYAVLCLVLAVRLAELALARRNTRCLIAQGAVEVGAGHYPALVALHAAWFACLALSVDPSTHVALWWLAGFAALQIPRLWVLLTLGRFWTTRVITLPAAPLIRRGPYRFLRHPNYLIVALEIAVLPMAFGRPAQALIFSVLNGLLLWHRVRIEAAALAPRQVIEKGTS